MQRYSKAADKGDAEAMFRLGLCWLKGRGLPKVEQMGLSNLTKAAKLGHAEAQYLLAICSLFSKRPCREGKYKFVARWLRKAAEQGVVEAQHNIGMCYLYGKGVKQDSGKAAEWLLGVAEKGNVDAQYTLGVLYYLGDGVQQDIGKCLEWLTKAAEQGDADAQSTLGMWYMLGSYVRKDYSKGESLMDSALQGADKNTTISKYRSFFGDGGGVPRDIEELPIWDENVIGQELNNAQANLGFNGRYRIGVATFTWDEKTKTEEMGVPYSRQLTFKGPNNSE